MGGILAYFDKKISDGNRPFFESIVNLLLLLYSREVLRLALTLIFPLFCRVEFIVQETL